jgi:purine-nucleoside phosphorylase
MSNELARIAAKQLMRKLDIPAFDVAIQLGTGWHVEGVGESFGSVHQSRIAGFDREGVEGHGTDFHALVTDSGTAVLVLGSRAHLYQGATPDEVAHGVRTAHEAGCRSVVLTNAAGAVNLNYDLGDIIGITDHLNLTGTSPAREFVDMSGTYEYPGFYVPGITTGVYAQFRGPQFETPAEVRMARSLGADLVGMSTALETIAARECGMKVIGLSLVTNYAAGLTDEPIRHDDVLGVGSSVRERIAGVLQQVFDAL